MRSAIVKLEPAATASSPHGLHVKRTCSLLIVVVLETSYTNSIGKASSNNVLKILGHVALSVVVASETVQLSFGSDGASVELARCNQPGRQT